MNVELLERVKQHILDEPRRLMMGIVHSDDVSFLEEERRPPCGTVGCIAGWVCVLSGLPAENVHPTKARTLLGITLEQSARLFFSYGGEEYVNAWRGRGTQEEADLIAARIDKFIRTNGTDLEIELEQ